MRRAIESATRALSGAGLHDEANKLVWTTLGEIYNSPITDADQSYLDKCAIAAMKTFCKSKHLSQGAVTQAAHCQAAHCQAASMLAERKKRRGL